ncbi:MAG: YraN family protein [Leptospirales bacterium]|nr:YraN family protein [Leptospirales bacterium]
MTKGYKKIFGADGESAASEFLESNGFTIIERNFSAGRSGETDIIAIKEKLLLFAEVKARSSEKYGGGIYSITEGKKRKLRTSAKFFLLKNPKYNSPEYSIRFDLITIQDGNIEWIDDIIR